jgi:Tfp pilus assembly protein PilV
MRHQSGFNLIDLLIALVISMVGMLAVAAFMYAVGKGWVTPK